MAQPEVAAVLAKDFLVAEIVARLDPPRQEQAELPSDSAGGSGPR